MKILFNFFVHIARMMVVIVPIALHAGTDNSTVGKIKIVSPHYGRENVSKQAEIVIRSADPIDPASITWNYRKTDGSESPTVRLTSERSKDLTGDQKNIASWTGEYTLSTDKKLLTFKPARLEMEMKYSFVVSGLKATGDNDQLYDLPPAYGAFTTVEMPVKIFKVFPEQGAVINPNDLLSVEFTKPLKSYATPLGNIVSLEIYLPRRDVDKKTRFETYPVDVKLSLSEDGKMLLVKPTQVLPGGCVFGLAIHTSYLTGDERDDYTAVFETNKDVSKKIKSDELTGIVPGGGGGSKLLCTLTGIETSSDGNTHLFITPPNQTLCNSPAQATVSAFILDDAIITGHSFDGGNVEAPKDPKFDLYTTTLTRDAAVEFLTEPIIRPSGDFKIDKISFDQFDGYVEHHNPYAIGGSNGFPVSKIKVNPQFQPPTSDPSQRTGPRLYIHFTKPVNHDALHSQAIELAFLIHELADGGVPQIDPLLNKTDPPSVCRTVRDYNLLLQEGVVYHWQDDQTLVWDVFNDVVDLSNGTNCRFDMRKLTSALITVTNTLIFSQGGDMLAPITNTLLFTTEYPNLRMSFQDICFVQDGDLVEQVEPGELFNGLIALRYNLNSQKNDVVAPLGAPASGEEYTDPEAKFRRRDGVPIRGVRYMNPSGCAAGWTNKKWYFKGMTENDQVKLGVSSFDADCGDLFVFWGIESFNERAQQNISGSVIQHPVNVGEEITKAMEQLTENPIRRWSDATCICGIGSPGYPGGDDWLGQADTPYWSRVTWWGYNPCTPYLLTTTTGVGPGVPVVKYLIELE